MELTREVLDCMKALRRKIREEQAVDIRMSQPDAIAAMLNACRVSADEELRRLGQRLAQFSDRPFECGADEPATGLRTAQPLVTPPGGSVRIYRGQRVYA